MADAPSGGKWEPFEIAVVVILLGGLLMRLTGTLPKTNTPSSESSTTTTTQTQAGEQHTCGLSIARPHSLEKVTSSVTLNGNLTGCNWYPKDGIALYAQVVDARGTPVSDYTAVAASDLSDTPSFMTMLPITGTPKKGTGYVILVAAKNTQARTITARIPIKF